MDRDLLNALDDSLSETHAKVSKLDDLCGTLVEKNEQLRNIFRDTDEYLVLGCFKRSMDILLQQAGIKPGYRHVNLIESERDEILRIITKFSGENDSSSSYSEITQDSGWQSWYPVLDYSRCTNCGQCADFCLFGVYEKADSRVNVVKPENCKINCPACARICPSTAIIFPKYKHGGAIGGSDLVNEQEEMQRQARDINDFLGGDITAALEKRKLKRQSIIRQEVMKKAISERESALKESQVQMGSEDVNI